MTTTLLRLFAWSLAAAVTFATLGPPSYRPHASHLGQDGEHALAFILIGLAFGLAYARHRLLTTAVAVVSIGLLEILQFWAPGRHHGNRRRRRPLPGIGRRRQPDQDECQRMLAILAGLVRP